MGAQDRELSTAGKLAHGEGYLQGVFTLLRAEGRLDEAVVAGVREVRSAAALVVNRGEESGSKPTRGYHDAARLLGQVSVLVDAGYVPEEAPEPADNGNSQLAQRLSGSGEMPASVEDV
jgi:hypothetical protein